MVISAKVHHVQHHHWHHNAAGIDRAECSCNVVLGRKTSFSCELGGFKRK